MKNIYFLLTLVLGLNLHAQNCEGRYQTEIFPNVDITTVEYGQAGGQSLFMDIYQGQGDTVMNRPVIIFCFGGSFVTGDRNSPELVALATDFAQRGYVCASIDYRLFTGSALQLLQEETLVKVVFEAVHDGKAAIRYFRKNAIADGNTLGIDTNQIFIGGTSAGGILGINLAYIDRLSKLPTNWRVWAEEIGGLEGNSGNPGYCSAPNATFGFAGAVADTSYIDENDVPFYGIHAVGDQTVQYGFGPPLNGFAPISLYGSGPIETRMNNLGIYNLLDTYQGADHPPFGGNNYDTTLVHFSSFLYNILDCNPNNFKKPEQQDCRTFVPMDTIVIEEMDSNNMMNPSVSIQTIGQNESIRLFPNPSSGILNIESEDKIHEVRIIDLIGRTAYVEQTNKNSLQLNLSNLNNGVFFIHINIDGNWYVEKFNIKN